MALGCDVLELCLSERAVSGGCARVMFVVDYIEGVFRWCVLDVALFHSGGVCVSRSHVCGWFCFCAVVSWRSYEVFTPAFSGRSFVEYVSGGWVVWSVFVFCVVEAAEQGAHV